LPLPPTAGIFIVLAGEVFSKKNCFGLLVSGRLANTICYGAIKESAVFSVFEFCSLFCEHEKRLSTTAIKKTV